SGSVSFSNAAASAPTIAITKPRITASGEPDGGSPRCAWSVVIGVISHKAMTTGASASGTRFIVRQDSKAPAHMLFDPRPPAEVKPDMRGTALPLVVAAFVTLTVSAAPQQNPLQTPVQTPQTPQQQQPVFRGGTTLVPVDVRVIDRTGKPVTDLSQKDFVV